MFGKYEKGSETCGEMQEKREEMGVPRRVGVER